MRDIAVIGFAQALNEPKYSRGNDVEILLPVVAAAVDNSGLARKDIQFTTGGSNDFLAGMAFSFVRALDTLGIYPTLEDSHVEMDGAWALYEAWVRLLLGDIDTALVWGLGATGLGKLNELMTLSVDPYYMAPLGPDPSSIAALSARAMIDAGKVTERELAEIAAQRQADAMNNPNVVWERAKSAAEIMAEGYRASPLRPSTSTPQTDGAAVVVLAAGDAARRVCKRPAWIRGMDHRTDAHSLGVRDLTSSESARLAGEKVGVANGAVDVAELHAVCAHEEVILKGALGLGASTRINPSGGPLTANPMMATGLIRIGEAANHILNGKAKRVLAHASAGPCLQNNLVMIMEAE